MAAPMAHEHLTQVLAALAGRVQLHENETLHLKKKIEDHEAELA